MAQLTPEIGQQAMALFMNRMMRQSGVQELTMTQDEIEECRGHCIWTQVSMDKETGNHTITLRLITNEQARLLTQAAEGAG